MKRVRKGDVVIADANLKTANVNLGYTEITAPISRRDRPHQADQGQCRQPGQRPADR